MATEQPVSEITSLEAKASIIGAHEGKRKNYTQAEIDLLNPAIYGVGSLERDDGVKFWCDGVSFTPVSSGGGSVTGLTVVSSVAALSALDHSTLADGDIVYVKGYHAGLFYGGGMIQIHKISVATVDNIVTFAATGGGRWKRAGDISTVDVTWAGAKIDDSTFDSRPAFNNAFFHLVPGSLKRSVSAPAGEFYFNSKSIATDNSGFAGKWATLVYSNTEFSGAGKYQTKITMHDNCPHDTPFMRLDQGSSDITLHDFYHDGNRLGRGIADISVDEDEGIDGKDTTNLHVYNVYIRETGQDGIDMDGGLNQRYSNLTIEDCNGFALHLGEVVPQPGNFSDNVTVRDCKFRRNGLGRGQWFPEVYAVNIQGGGATIDNCDFEENYAGIVFQRERPHNKVLNSRFTNLVELNGDNVISSVAPGTIIKNNRILTSLPNGAIRLSATAIGSVVDSNTIIATHSVIAGASYSITVGEGSSATNNNVTTNALGIILGGIKAKAINNTVETTNLTKSDAYPIQFTNAATGGVAQANTISATGATTARGIYNNGAADTLISANTISDHRGSIRCSSAVVGGQISSNIGDNVAGHDTILMDAGSTGVFVTGNSAELSITDSGTNIITNNVIAGVLVP